MVIGFSGRPVLAATGWKPPILYAPETDSAFLEASPSDVWCMAEVRRFEQGSLLSLLPSPIPFKRGTRLVYAHDLFIRPEAKGSPILAFGALEYVPRLESYVAFNSEDEALRLYRKWADQLLASAQGALLSGRSAELALATAMRARYCTLPAALHELRQQTFTLAFASLAVLDRPIEPLLEDARADFSDDELAVIEQEGTALAADRGEREIEREAAHAAFLTRDCDLEAVRGGLLRAEAQVP
jgi:hypothetical protein